MTGRIARWHADLGLGARLALGGGREGRIRLALTAVGVGLGVALLLLAASVPNLLDARAVRGDARSDLGFDGEPSAASERTILIVTTDTEYRGVDIRGRLVRPEGTAAPVPPGLRRLPAPGEMVVSPALRQLLAGEDGALLRQRLPYRIVGTIGDDGLLGPGEHAYYAGWDRLEESRVGTTRLDHFGYPHHREPLDPLLLLIVLVGWSVLLFPVGVFVAVTVRFGGENRDRRLAALRLVGADRRMLGRIAAGEALVGAVTGLLVGVGLFVLGRRLVELVTLLDISVFAHDVRPATGFALLILVAVPVCALVAALVAMRSVVVEPLGVVRRSTPVRRRLWWRPIPVLVGVALLAPLAGSVTRTSQGFNEVQLVGGILALLVGLVTLLPWLIEAVVHRLGGAWVAWQLAVRRLQLSGGTPTRAVSGLAVAVVGVVALHALFGAAAREYSTPTGEDLERSPVLVGHYLPKEVTTADTADAARTAMTGRLAAVPGVQVVDPLGTQVVSLGNNIAILVVGDCRALDLAVDVDQCSDGDVFLAAAATSADPDWVPAPGQEVTIGEPDGDDGRTWTVPANARTVGVSGSAGNAQRTVYLTPSAAAAAGVVPGRFEYHLRLDRHRPDTVELVRNAAARVDPLAFVEEHQRFTVLPRFASVQTALRAGMVAVLLLVGAGLLIGTLEQLRERRRLLAVLAAFGTDRGTMSWSVLWQNTIPLLLALLLAVPAGAGLGALLLTLTRLPATVDWPVIGFAALASLGTVLLITVLSMPPLWRMMRPAGLRTE